MNFFEPILRLIESAFGRTVAKRHHLPHLLDYLGPYLKDKGFPHADRVTSTVGVIMLEEAFRRAGEKEKDGVPRTKGVIAETALVADDIIAVFNGDPDANPRIKSILSFHQVLPGESHGASRLDS